MDMDQDLFKNASVGFMKRKQRHTHIKEARNDRAMFGSSCCFKSFVLQICQLCTLDPPGFGQSWLLVDCFEP
jgi:hypothetical protein